MKVVLQKNVTNLGDAGDIKEVASGYARNYLLPRKLAMVAHADSSQALLHQKRLIANKLEKRDMEMADVAKALNSLEALDIPVRVGSKDRLFGSVTSLTIATILQEKGFPIDRRKIELGEKIKTLGSYRAKVRLTDKSQPIININVISDGESEEEEYFETEKAAPEEATTTPEEVAAEESVAVATEDSTEEATSETPEES